MFGGFFVYWFGVFLVIWGFLFVGSGLCLFGIGWGGPVIDLFDMFGVFDFCHLGGLCLLVWGFCLGLFFVWVVFLWGGNFELLLGFFGVFCPLKNPKFFVGFSLGWFFLLAACTV